jgi:hypothetical protein
MKEDERGGRIRSLLFNYVRSPSLQHIRDPHSLQNLTLEILKAIDRSNSIWTKWDGQREVVLKSAMPCWIPIEDLREFLNLMPGPKLTNTDVTQRVQAFEADQLFDYPNDKLQSGCLAIYQREKEAGTELPAIIGLLREYVEREEGRIAAERRERYQQYREQAKIDMEQRLLSGADCGWTQIQKSTNYYCRANGRTFRLSPSKDKMWNLHRVESASDDEKGAFVGKYRQRRDATKVVKEMAYRSDPTR